MSGYIGSKASVTLVDGYTQADADAEFVQDPNGSDTDGLTDLGDTNNRFKDLYLSGGVYLGGTGADNKLDDYEEGSYTATLTGSSGGTYNLYPTQSTLRYIKVGNMVTVFGGLRVASLSSPIGGYIRLNLPFTCISPADESARSAGSIAFANPSWSGTLAGGNIAAQAVYAIETNTSSVTVNNSFRFTITYEAQ